MVVDEYELGLHCVWSVCLSVCVVRQNDHKVADDHTRRKAESD